MSEDGKCPKCGGEMKRGYVRGTGGQYRAVHLADEISFWREGNVEKTYALACQSCGYVELYIDRENRL